jgi:hypothetical protein
MKKVIGKVGAMVLGGILGATISCEGMQQVGKVTADDVAYLIRMNTQGYTLHKFWATYFSRDFDPRMQAGTLERCTLLSHAARSGDAKLMVAMGHLDTLEATDLADLIAGFGGDSYSARDRSDALKQIVTRVIENRGIDAVQRARSKDGRTIGEVIESLGRSREDAMEILTAAGFPIQ